MEKRGDLSSWACLRRKGNRVILCIIACTVVSVTACSWSVTLPTKSSPFGEVQVVSCESIEQDSPISVTQVFTNPRQQICVFVDARLENSAAEVLTTGELVSFNSTWYHNGEMLGSRSIASSVLPDRRVTMGDCMTATNSDSLPTGQYRVEIEQGSIKVGEVEFRVE